MSDKVYTVQDYKSGQPRWCPGCGDPVSYTHLTLPTNSLV